MITAEDLNERSPDFDPWADFGYRFTYRGRTDTPWIEWLDYDGYRVRAEAVDYDPETDVTTFEVVDAEREDGEWPEADNFDI